MKIFVKNIMENLKAISNVTCDFVYIDVTDSSNYALYISTDVQAIKVPLEITDVTEDEKKIYVVNKVEFTHLIPYVTEFINFTSDYSYMANENAIKGKFESNDSYSEELESRKMLFDKESEYEDFAEVTPSIMEGITSGSIFVSPDSIKASERYLDVKDHTVFSYSKMQIYINKIDVDHEGLLSSEVIKAIQSLGVGAIIKSNNDSLLLTNAQRSIFIYQSIANDVDYHPVLEEKFQAKIQNVKTFNKITLNIEDLKNKLDYIFFYSQKNPNTLCYLNVENDKVSLSTDENTFVELPTVEFEKTEEFETMNVPFNCQSMQLITAKVGKECENLSWFVSSDSSNKLMLLQFGDSDEIVVIAKLNL